jgi:nicotinate-nucleotide adenylyltransferase
MKVAVFGGSFNPPHVGHVLACALVLCTEDIDRVLVVPAYKHAFAKALAPFEDRVRMCELAMGWLEQVDISRVEEDLGGDSLTIRTLEHLAQAHPTWRLRLIVGADILAETPRWACFARVQELAPLIVLGRPGVAAPTAPPALLPDVSSTHVRAAVAQAAWGELAALVPRAVLEHVRAQRLYDAPP